MKNSKLIKWGATHALGVLVYILLLNAFFNKANDWFGSADVDIITPAAAMMVFVFSALVTGGLVLGKPIMLYIDRHKKDGVKLLLFTGLSMFILTALVFATILIIK